MQHAYDGVYTPFDGETFSTWVFRFSLFEEISAMQDDEIAGLYTRWSLVENFDPDYSFDSGFFIECCESLDFRVEFFAAMFSSGSKWVMPFHFRRAYCHQCFCEQIQAQKYPGCLTKWGVVYYTVCDLHKNALCEAPSPNPKALDRAMHMFRLSYQRGSNLFAPNHCPPILIDAASLAQSRFLEWDDISRSYQSDTVKLLMRLLLYPRYGLVSQRYVVRMKYPAVQSFRQLLHYGALTANVFQRRLATVLTAIILGIYDRKLSSQLLGVINDLFPAHIPISSMQQLGSLSNVFISSLAPGLHDELKSIAAKFYSEPLVEFASGFYSLSSKKSYGY
ncbi:hypothetical protein ACYZUA_16655 [Pseudomonas sp. LS2P72]